MQGDGVMVISAHHREATFVPTTGLAVPGGSKPMRNTLDTILLGVTSDTEATHEAFVTHRRVAEQIFIGYHPLKTNLRKMQEV